MKRILVLAFLSCGFTSQYRLPTDDTCTPKLPTINVCVISYMLEDVSPNKDRTKLKGIQGVSVQVSNGNIYISNSLGYVTYDYPKNTEVTVKANLPSTSPYKSDLGQIFKVAEENLKTPTFLQRK